MSEDGLNGVSWVCGDLTHHFLSTSMTAPRSAAVERDGEGGGEGGNFGSLRHSITLGNLCDM